MVNAVPMRYCACIHGPALGGPCVPRRRLTNQILMDLSMNQRLQTSTRTFFGLGLAVLSIYLFFANLSFFFDALGWFDSGILHVTDLVTLAAAVTVGVLGALRVGLPLAKQPSVEKIELIAETLVRYCLGFILPIYGATKILNVQFRLPFAALDTPLGQASGYALTWRFSGYSYTYELFLGLGEFVGAVLLFFRRTTTLGACVLLAIVANVALLNFTHDLPVKFKSTCYLVMVCYLIGLDSPRLSALFLENKAFGPRPTPERLLSPRVRNVSGFLKAGYILFAVVYAFVYILIADSKPSAVCGSWTVTRTEFLDGKAGGAQPPALPWQKIFFEREIRGVFVGSVKEVDGGKRKRFCYDVSPHDRHLALRFNEPLSGPPFSGSYQFLDDQTLKLAGNLGEHGVEILLARQE